MGRGCYSCSLRRSADVLAGRLLITATLAEIDGAGDSEGHTLGFAGPYLFWVNRPTTSLTGAMTFNIYGIGQLESETFLEGAILHEMGHVIGVGYVYRLGYKARCVVFFFLFRQH